MKRKIIFGTLVLVGIILVVSLVYEKKFKTVKGTANLIDKNVCTSSKISNAGNGSASAPYYFSFIGQVTKLNDYYYSIGVNNIMYDSYKGGPVDKEPETSSFKAYLKKDGETFSQHNLAIRGCKKFEKDICVEGDSGEGTFVFFTAPLAKIPDEIEFWYYTTPLCSVSLK